MRNLVTKRGFFCLLLALLVFRMGIVAEADVVTATLVVAAADSKNITRADYQCDGIGDQVEIQAAINALPAGGGRVVLLEGSYNINADISLASRVTIEGQGFGTILKPTSPDLNILKLVGTVADRKNLAVIRNLAIGGGYTGVTEIKIDYADEVLIDNVALTDTAYGLYVTNSRRLKLDNSLLANHTTNAIYLNTSSDFHSHKCFIRDQSSGDCLVYSGTKSSEDGGLSIVGMIVINNSGGYALKLQGVLEGSLVNVKVDSGAKGIYIDNSGYMKLTDVWVGAISGINENGITLGGGSVATAVSRLILTNVHVISAQKHGIYFNYASDNTLSNIVSCDNRVDGIRFGSGSSRNSLTSSILLNNGQSGSGSGISIGQEGSVFDITVSGCVSTDNQGVKTQEYGLRVEGWSDLIMVVNNDFVGNKTAGVYRGQVGSSVIVKHNLGYVTEKGGVASVANGGTIAHGLVGTPTAYGVTATVARRVVAVTAVDGTNLTIGLRNDAGTAITTPENVSWHAEYYP